MTFIVKTFNLIHYSQPLAAQAGIDILKKGGNAAVRLIF
jgi:gamma-glutamyltranspeptidase